MCVRFDTKFLLLDGKDCSHNAHNLVGCLCKLRSDHLENRAFHERAYPRSVGNAVVSNAELGKVTMGRKILPLSANFVRG